MLGVVTVKRMTLWIPGVTSPSITLQKSAGKFSTRVTQLFWGALLSTMRSGRPGRSWPFLTKEGPSGIRLVSVVVSPVHARERARKGEEEGDVRMRVSPASVGA